MGLEGSLVRLREQRRNDVELLQALRNDMRTQGWNQSLPPDYTREMLLAAYEGRAHGTERSDGQFVIERLADGKAVGSVRYLGLQPRWSATIGIAVVPEAWGTGVALDAQETLLRFLFLDLGVRVVRLWSHSGNTHGIGLAERSGFRLAMRARASCYKRGTLSGICMMDLLRPEYFTRHPEMQDTLPAL